jgi:hypothetical protein
MSARGGTRIPLWSPGFRYRPDVEPPGLLRLVAALCIVSIVGTLVYAVGVTISANGTAMPEPVAAAYVALLHFVLPFGITFAVQTNHWISRPLLLCYALLLCGATAAGHGWLGQLLPSAPARITGAMAALLMLLAWLFGSKRMRIYYARLSGSRLSPELYRIFLNYFEPEFVREEGPADAG